MGVQGKIGRPRLKITWMINGRSSCLQGWNKSKVTDNHEWTTLTPLYSSRTQPFWHRRGCLKEHNFFPRTGSGGRWFKGDVHSALHLLCTLFPCYYISSTSGHQARSWSLGTPALTHLSAPATHLTSASYPGLNISVFFHLLPLLHHFHWSLHYTLISIFAWECSREGKGDANQWISPLPKFTMSIPYLLPPNTRYYKLQSYILTVTLLPFQLHHPHSGLVISCLKEHLQDSVPVHLLSAAPAQANYDVTWTCPPLFRLISNMKSIDLILSFEVTSV